MAKKKQPAAPDRGEAPPAGAAAASPPPAAAAPEADAPAAAAAAHDGGGNPAQQRTPRTGAGARRAPSPASPGRHGDLSSLPPALLTDVLRRVPLVQRLGSTALASGLLRAGVGATIDSVSSSVGLSSPAGKQESLTAWLAAHGQHVTALRLQPYNAAAGVQLHGLAACTALHELRLTAHRVGSYGAWRRASSNPAAEVLFAPGAVSALRDLTALQLDPCGANSLERLSTLTALVELDVAGPNPQHLAQLQVLSQLTRLCVSKASGSSSSLTLQELPVGLAALQNLESLDVAILTGLSQLSVLKLGCSKVSNSSGSAVLADSAGTLTRVVLGYMPAEGWAPLFSAERPLLQLRSLRVSEPPSAMQLTLVPAAAPALQELCLTNTVGFGMPQCFSQLSGLTRLHIVDGEPECASELVSLRHLQRLYFNAPTEGGHGARPRHFLELTALTRLTAVRIDARDFFDINLQAGGAAQGAGGEADLNAAADSDSEEFRRASHGKVTHTGNRPVWRALKAELEELHEWWEANGDEGDFDGF